MEENISKSSNVFELRLKLTLKHIVQHSQCYRFSEAVFVVSQTGSEIVESKRWKNNAQMHYDSVDMPPATSIQ